LVCFVDIGHYDIFIITCDDDQLNASKLADVLVKFSKCCCDYDLTVHPELNFGGNKLDHLRSGLALSTYRFIFIDDGFQECDLVKFGTDAALMEMINRHDQSIIPVKAHINITVPSLLRMFRSLDVHKLLRGKRLNDVDVDLLTDRDIDKALLANFVRMVSKSVCSAAFKLSAADQSPRPSSQHSETLRKHFTYLVDNMDPDHGLLSDLFSAKVISHREMENIRVEKTFYDRNEYLIRTLMRKSEKDFLEFVTVLRKDESYIADILCSDLASEKQS